MSAIKVLLWLLFILFISSSCCCCCCVSLLQDLDFESSQSYTLQIDARNPEPLMKGLEYGAESTASLTVKVTDVDEPPQFHIDLVELPVLENIPAGSVLMTLAAKDPEGKEIR